MKTAPTEAVVDLNLVHMWRGGFWECKGCKKVTNTVIETDRLDHEEHAICVLCGSRNVRWRAPGGGNPENVVQTK